MTDYDRFDGAVKAKVGAEAFDEWINHGLAEAVEDWYAKWIARVSGNSMTRSSLVANIASEAVEAFRSGVNRGVERCQEAFDDASL